MKKKHYLVIEDAFLEGVDLDLTPSFAVGIPPNTMYCLFVGSVDEWGVGEFKRRLKCGFEKNFASPSVPPKEVKRWARRVIRGIKFVPVGPGCIWFTSIVVGLIILGSLLYSSINNSNKIPEDVEIRVVTNIELIPRHDGRQDGFAVTLDDGRVIPSCCNRHWDYSIRVGDQVWVWGRGRIKRYVEGAGFK